MNFLLQLLLSLLPVDTDLTLDNDRVLTLDIDLVGGFLAKKIARTKTTPDVATLDNDRVLTLDNDLVDCGTRARPINGFLCPKGG